MAVTTPVPALPDVTSDLDQACADLDELGVARIADALSRGRARRRCAPGSSSRRRPSGRPGWRSSTAAAANQRVWNLPSKGEAFRDLLRKPLVRTLARHVLDGDYCLSSHTANIAGPGGAPMVLHSDQGYAPRAIEMALTMNVMWMLVDFTEENGATRLVPGSHRIPAEPPGDRPVATVPGIGPAGTALVFDGRIWHGTGANTTADEYRYGVLTYFCRPWMRPQENYTLSTHPDVLATADDELRALLGLRVWRTLGGVEGPWGPGTPGDDRVPHRRLRQSSGVADR